MKERRAGSLGWGKIFVPDVSTNPIRVIPGWSEGPDPESRDSGFIAARCPGMTQKDSTAPTTSRLVRIEPLFKAVPAIRIIILQRRGFCRVRSNALQIPRF